LAKEEVQVEPEVKKDQTESWYGTGRRKTAIARAKITLGGSVFTVNDKPVEVYFPGEASKIVYQAALKAVGRLDDISASLKVEGGGPAAQLGAVSLALARSLIEYDPALRPTVSRAGLLRRDPRMKESKHFGLMGARKRKQSPKR
jgi:small subunit ribosomal protein S9